jgi:dTDP-4-amino-4,6-dideoxygalactose transaminase
LGDTACFSFYATKSLSCGEGGALVTDDLRLAEKVRLLRLHGMDKTAADRFREGYQHWDMVMLGWKYNMSNIEAALLLPQMDRLEENWRKRDALARMYEGALSNISGLSLPETLPGARHARHLFTVRVGQGRRDGVLKGLREAGIGAMVNYRAIHLLTYFRETFGFKEGDFAIAERIGNETLSLPFYAKMPTAHVPLVAQTLKDLLE